MRRCSEAAVWLCLVVATLVAAPAQGETARSRSAEAALLAQPFATLDGRRETLSQAMTGGRWTLVMIWSVGCRVCRQEMPAISKIHDGYHGALMQVVGLAIDGVDASHEVDGFRSAYGMRFPTLLADLETISAAYRLLTEEPLRGTPTVLLFDRERRIRGIHLGPLRPQALLAFIERRS